MFVSHLDGVRFYFNQLVPRTADSVSSGYLYLLKESKEKTLERPLIPGLMRVKLDLSSALLDIISAICFKNSPFDVKEFNSPVPNTYTNWIQNISLKITYYFINYCQMYLIPLVQKIFL